VPKSLYEHFKNDKRQILGIHGQGNRGTEILQDGEREYLLCESCEQHLNEELEKPFRRWLETLFPANWQVGERATIRVDYKSFKLFHLSVLFRAGVCALPTFAEVSLGPKHRERIRRMLVEMDPGSALDYTIRGALVVDRDSRQPYPAVVKPRRVKVQGHTFYQMMYGGAEWWVRVSSHSEISTDADALTAGGEIVLEVTDWRESSALQFAGMVLRREVRAF
jgi:hypothetical protein